ncbi:MAG: class I SAM-dependent rRNA methyltransferase, partial [Sphaerochaetaceae bacterium]|nr:class I SAM-dependent rRNA methyltransferase [Sphaerochaetaceae bacterium]
MNGQYKIIRIRQGKEKQLVRHHPWMFSGAVEHEKSPEEIGVGIVQIHDSQDRFIAYGWHDPKSHILVRLLSWDAQMVPDETWWIDMIRSAVRRRLPLFSDARQ